MRALAEGDDGGYFADGGAVWTVHAGTATFVAGIRALLIQALHPGAMAGVHDFSRYREDPIGRLTGTVRWVICVTYGSTQQAHAETARVARLHQRVAGTYSTDTGPRTYSASDASLLEWVHLAFTEAFLGAHQRWGGPIPGGADAYVREWAQAGRLMGVAHPPVTLAELRAEMSGFLEHSKVDERVITAVGFIRRPGLPGLTAKVYPILFGGAVASLPAAYRELLGLRRPWWPAITLTRIALTVAHWTLGRISPSERNARLRIARLASDAAHESDPQAA